MKIKYILPVLAIAGCFAFSACDITETLKPTNTPFYDDNNKHSPGPSNILPSVFPSISPDLEPNNSPGNNPPELIPNPTVNDTANGNID